VFQGHLTYNSCALPIFALLAALPTLVCALQAALPHLLIAPAYRHLFIVTCLSSPDYAQARRVPPAALGIPTSSCSLCTPHQHHDGHRAPETTCQRRRGTSPWLPAFTTVSFARDQSRHRLEARGRVPRDISKLAIHLKEPSLRRLSKVQRDTIRGVTKGDIRQVQNAHL
jgi:hypothetical protein